MTWCGACHSKNCIKDRWQTGKKCHELVHMVLTNHLPDDIARLISEQYKEEVETPCWRDCGCVVCHVLPTKKKRRQLRRVNWQEKEYDYIML